MTVAAYINFNGNCREAVEYYAEVFQTEKPQISTFGEAPKMDFPLPEEAKNLVLYTELTIEGSKIMFSDTFPGSPFTVGNNISIAVMSENIDKLTSFFNKLKEEGQVQMELQETFWAKCYGVVKDKFGVTWQVSSDDK